MITALEFYEENRRERFRAALREIDRCVASVLPKVKTCSCGTAYTRAELLALPEPERGGVQYDEDGAPLLYLRNCMCLSTLCLEVES